MAILETIRDRFHPLHQMRKSTAGRFVLRAVDQPAWVSIPGIRFKVRGRRLSHGLSYQVDHEHNPSALALACIKHFRFQSFWDIGANFGYYSWLLKSVNPDLKVVLVEPLPANADLIHNTIAHNQLKDVHLIEAGASAFEGNGTLRADTSAGSTSSLNDEETFEERNFGVAPTLLAVPLIALDSLLRHHNPPDFVKIDVEGHEAEVLKGAAEVILRYEPIFFIECSHYPEHHCLKALEMQGYKIVDGDKLVMDRSEWSMNFVCFPPKYSDSVDAVLRIVRNQQ